MAWTGIDDFDGYTLTADLDTLNGGSGWSAAWAKFSGTGVMTIETAPAGGQGGKAVRAQSAIVDTAYRRSITPTAAGTMGVRMRISINNPNDNVAVGLISEGGSPVGYVRFGPAATIQIYNQDTTVYEDIQAYSVDTWYTIEMDFDDGAQNDKYRARVNGGTYTAYKGTIITGWANLAAIVFDDSATNAHTTWFDDIGLQGTVEGGAATLMGQILM